MKINDNNSSWEIERAILFLVNKLPNPDRKLKPIVLHSIRVGLSLDNFGYNKKIVIAAILHDLIEDANVTAEEIKTNFGQKIASLVGACSHQGNLDRVLRYEKLFDQAKKYSKDALIIEVADILDNSNYYHLANDQKTFIYCLEKIKYFINFATESLKTEPIFIKLVNHYNQNIKNLKYKK